MPLPFSAHFQIRQYELNSRDELPNSTLSRLFQETAMLASLDAGFGVDWYITHRSVWVIHAMTIEHVRPIRYLDDLAITTWLSDVQRVRTHREYLARNEATGQVVARGRAYWVHLNRDNLLPTHIPVDLNGLFAPNGVRAVTRLEPRTYSRQTGLPPEQRIQRHVQRYEADGMQHVNNAVYIDWLEEALADALRLPERQSTDTPRLCIRRHDIDYVRSALPGEDVEIMTRPVGVGQCASAWVQEITRAGELLVRDRVIALWLDAIQRALRWKMPMQMGN